MNHFSTLPLTRKKHLDIATQLRDFSSGAINSETSESGIDILRWHRHGEYKAVVDSKPYTPYDRNSAYWEVKIEIAPTNEDTFTEVAKTVVAGDKGTCEIPLSGELVANALDLETNSALFAPVMRATATPVGSPGDLNYSAYLTPC